MDKGPWHGGKLAMVWFVFTVAAPIGVIIVVGGGGGWGAVAVVWVWWLLLAQVVLVPRTLKWGRSRIGNWHGGMLCLVWALSTLPALPFAWALNAVGKIEHAVIGFAATWLLTGAVWVIPITREWLSAREES